MRAGRTPRPARRTFFLLCRILRALKTYAGRHDEKGKKPFGARHRHFPVVSSITKKVRAGSSAAWDRAQCRSWERVDWKEWKVKCRRRDLRNEGAAAEKGGRGGPPRRRRRKKNLSRTRSSNTRSTTSSSTSSSTGTTNRWLRTRPIFLDTAPLAILLTEGTNIGTPARPLLRRTSSSTTRPTSRTRRWPRCPPIRTTPCPAFLKYLPTRSLREARGAPRLRRRPPDETHRRPRRRPVAVRKVRAPPGQMSHWTVGVGSFSVGLFGSFPMFGFEGSNESLSVRGFCLTNRIQTKVSAGRPKFRP
jgi:hypothetical protein